MNARQLLLLLLCATALSSSYAQSYEWALGIGSNSASAEDGNAIAVDAAGNVLVGGEFRAAIPQAKKCARAANGAARATVFCKPTKDDSPA